MAKVGDKTIYELALHEEIRICAGIYALRVPGGWRYLDSGAHEATSCFVPFNNEFWESSSPQPSPAGQR